MNKLLTIELSLRSLHSQTFELANKIERCFAPAICRSEAKRLLGVKEKTTYFTLGVIDTKPKEKGWKKFVFLPYDKGNSYYYGIIDRTTVRIHKLLYHTKKRKNLPDTLWVKVLDEKE